MIEKETKEERAARLQLETHARGIGRAIADSCPQGVGFVLILFDFGEKGNMAYMSNGVRQDVLRLLAEARQKIQGQ